MNATLSSSLALSLSLSLSPPCPIGTPEERIETPDLRSFQLRIAVVFVDSPPFFGGDYLEQVTKTFIINIKSKH